MAEFIDVIYTVQRICKQNKGHCPVCILGKYACPNNARFDKNEEDAFREFEDAVVKWAKEHPKPVYPAWAEWLNEMGFIISDTGSFVCYEDHLAHVDIKEVDMLSPKAYEPIDEETAKKLGIKPKEVKEK